MPLINSGIIDKCSLTNEQRELRKLLRISYFFFFFLFSILLSLSAMLVESQSQEWIESSVKKGKWRTVFNLRNITTNSCSRNLGSLAHQCHRQVLSIKFLLPVLNRWSYYFSSQRDQIFFFFFFFFFLKSPPGSINFAYKREQWRRCRWGRFGFRVAREYAVDRHYWVVSWRNNVERRKVIRERERKEQEIERRQLRFEIRQVSLKKKEKKRKLQEENLQAETETEIFCEV